MTIIQRGTWPGWPDGVVVELASDTAAAVLTAARDYQSSSGRDLRGDFAALPVGGKRTLPEVTEMRAAFRARAAGAARSVWGPTYTKYNMDPASRAEPSLTSPHLTGYCIDISDSGFLAWLVVNGARYGLRRTLVAENDLRHFQFFPGTATAALDVTSLDGDTPAVPTRPKDTMNYSYISRATGPEGKPQYALLNVEFPDGAIVTQDVKIANGWASFDPTRGVSLTDAQWQPTLDQAKFNAVAHKASLASASAGQASPVDFTVLIAEIKALGVKLDGLPAEIDRYADGRKQAS